MHEEQNHDELIDLGAASALTLGEPEPLARENVTIEDFWN